MVAVKTFQKLCIPGLNLPCGRHYDQVIYISFEDLPQNPNYQAEWTKSETVLQSQECRNASVVILSKSGFHAMYRGSWWQSLDANRSRVGCPLCVATSCKTEASSFHSELLLVFPESQSLCIFRALRRYFADIIICLMGKKLQIDLVICKTSLLCVFPIFERYESAVLLSICK